MIWRYIIYLIWGLVVSLILLILGFMIPYPVIIHQALILIIISILIMLVCGVLSLGVPRQTYQLVIQSIILLLMFFTALILTAFLLYF